jgi:hypothetical protein
MRNHTDFERDYAYVKGCLDGIMSAKNDRVPNDYIDKMAQLCKQMESLTQELNLSPSSSSLPQNRGECDDSEKVLRPLKSSRRPTSASAKVDPIKQAMLSRVDTNHREEMVARVEHARMQRHVSEQHISSARQEKSFLPSNCKELRRAWSERDFERAYRAEAGLRPVTAEYYRQEKPPPAPIAKDIPQRRNHTHKRKSKSLNALVEVEPSRRVIKLFPVDQNFDKDMYSIIKSTKIVGSRQASSTRNWESSPNDWINKEDEKYIEKRSKIREMLSSKSKGSRALSLDGRLPGVAF